MDAFTAPCNVSVLTMMNVTKCPSTLSSYKEAAMKKNCLSWASETQDCRSFEYHCVLSDDFQYAIEVCAPSILIIGKILFLYVYILYHLRQIENARFVLKRTLCIILVLLVDLHHQYLCFENNSIVMILRNYWIYKNNIDKKFDWYFFYKCYINF